MHEKSPSQPPENPGPRLLPDDLKISAEVPSLHYSRSEWYADFYSSVSENGWVSFTVFPDAVSREEEAFHQFESEVQKMINVKADTKAAISPVLGYGLTETGSFPYIETNVPDGLALSELCARSPLTVYSLGEIARICGELSKALAHCHNSGLLHGAINTSNVWLDNESGLYQLCGFGPSFLPASRRLHRVSTSSKPGLPPEQLDGELLYQSDSYSFSALVFNLLLARPQGELPVEILSARENFYKDLLQYRSKAIASLDWREEQKAQEAAVPRWMMDLIYNSLHKNPRNRFSHGVKLYDFVLLNHLLSKEKSEEPRVYHRPRVNQVKVLESKNIEKIPAVVPAPNKPVPEPSVQPFVAKKKRFPRPVLLGLTVITLIAFGFLLSLMNKENPSRPVSQLPVQGIRASKQDIAGKKQAETAPDVVEQMETDPVLNKKSVPAVMGAESNRVMAINSSKPVEQKTQMKAIVSPKIKPEDVKGHCSTLNLNTGLGAYKVKSFAYFHNEPKENTKRRAFINHWNNAVLHAIKDENDFIYIVFTNYWGQTSKGWLKKSDIIPVEQDQSSAAK